MKTRTKLELLHISDCAHVTGYTALSNFVRAFSHKDFENARNILQGFDPRKEAGIQAKELAFQMLDRV